VVATWTSPLGSQKDHTQILNVKICQDTIF
jgi:hypothetical protein